MGKTDAIVQSGQTRGRPKKHLKAPPAAPPLERARMELLRRAQDREPKCEIHHIGMIGEFCEKCAPFPPAADVIAWERRTRALAARLWEEMSPAQRANLEEFVARRAARIMASPREY